MECKKILKFVANTIFIVLLIFCSAEMYGQSISLQKSPNLEDFTPNGWQVVDTAYGNLDRVDGDEAVVVYLSSEMDEYGSQLHHLGIFKKDGDEWKLWHQSASPLLGNKDGGLLGNPYGGISIERGALIIYQSGGSRWKWSYTHRYRFQNDDWYLIGVTVYRGAVGEYWEDFDYNLSTGIYHFKKTLEHCDKKGDCTDEVTTDTIVHHKVKLPRMDDFVIGSNEVTLGEDIEMNY